MEAAPASVSVTPTTELSEEVMKKKALSIIDEYLDIRSMEVGETVLLLKRSRLSASSQIELFIRFFLLERFHFNCFIPWNANA